MAMTLDEAIVALVDEFSIGDSVYDVRERAASDGAFKGNSWDHPKVLRFSEACAALEQHAKEVKRG